MPINIGRKYEAITGDSNQVLGAISCFLAGIGIVLLIEFLGKKFSKNKKIVCKIGMKI